MGVVMARFSGLLFGTVIAVLSNCGGSMVSDTVHRNGVPAMFTWGAIAGQFKVVVVGNPFAVEGDVFQQALTDAMQGHQNGPATRFTTKPDDSARSSYRFVMLFNAPRSMDSDALCEENKLPPPGTESGRTKVIAAFCIGSQLQSEVTASIPTASSPSAPSFRRMIANVTRALVPSDDPFDDGACSAPGCT
jgi:hypothetical protein